MRNVFWFFVTIFVILEYFLLLYISIIFLIFQYVFPGPSEVIQLSSYKITGLSDVANFILANRLQCSKASPDAKLWF